MSGEHYCDGQASNCERQHVTHRSSALTAWTRAAFAAIALLSSLIAHVAAGPHDDAVAASDRGDYATALRLWHSLAKQGGADAQISLGIMYNRGRGVPQDYVEAVKWFRLAADQGLDTAQYNLGIMYANGHGVPQDYVSAHMWLNLSAAQGLQIAAKFRYDFSKLMTPEQIAEAQKLARDWRPKRLSPAAAIHGTR